jgi:hypothetical protein
MSADERDTLKILKAELDFIEKGGYGRSVRTPWQPTSIFQDSTICLNYAEPSRPHPCEECLLIDFVPAGERTENVPCHFIPLDQVGDTVASLEGDQPKIEDRVRTWLRAKIAEMEAERTPKDAVPPSAQ